MRDHGLGAPSDFIPRVRRRFSRASGAAREAKGAGLGLWLVRALTRAGGGDAWHEPGGSGGSAAYCLRLRRAPPARIPPIGG
ncbi:ATP-binding protein [Streptomyces poonensis]|uniref:ATP-binding protein n=1 Tax=Streptomyces poonensis TaxID=68255 RepID=UPI001679D685